MTDQEVEESFHHNQGRVVKVDWIDAETSHGWDIYDADSEKWFEKNEPVTSVGIWVGLNKNFLILAGDTGYQEAKTFNRYIKIPRQWAVEVSILGSLSQPLPSLVSLSPLPLLPVPSA